MKEIKDKKIDFRVSAAEKEIFRKAFGEDKEEEEN